MGGARVEFGENVSWDDFRRESLSDKRSLKLDPHVKRTVEAARFPDSPMPLIRNEEGDLGVDSGVAREAEEVGALVKGELERRLGTLERKEVFLFIHGYNNQFNDAAITMAQLWHFMGRVGMPVIYSWPAGRGGLRGYTTDSESGKFTNYHLKQFLRSVAELEGLEKLHILAHSRGTDVAMTALKELHLEYRAQGRGTQAR